MTPRRRRDPDRCYRCRVGHLIVTDAGLKGWETTCLFCGHVDHRKNLSGRASDLGSARRPPAGDAA